MENENSGSAEVIVIGAGPVGLTLAGELLRHGTSCRIFDKSKEISRLSKAVGIHVRTLEILESMGAVEEFLVNGVKVNSIRVYANGEKILEADLKELRSPFTYLLDLPQSKTEELLESHLNSLGGKVERGVQCTGFEEKDDGVRVEIRHPDGREEIIWGCFLAGCDGENSMVRQGQGITLERVGEEKLYLVSDVVLSWQHNEDKWHLFCHNNGVLLFLPLGNRLWRVVASVRPEDQPEETPEYLWRLIEERGGHKSTHFEPQWLNLCRIQHEKAKSYSQGRVFLAGDAAHHYNLEGNQGMNTGIQDAFNLAWKLALACQGKILPGLLESYHAERKPVGEEVSRMTGLLAKVVNLKNPFSAGLRNRLVPLLANLEPIQARMVGKLEELDLSYRHSPVVGEFLSPSAKRRDRRLFQKGPRAGDRAPDGILTHARTGKPHRLFEVARTSKHTLFIFATFATEPEVVAHLAQIMRLCSENFELYLNSRLVCGRRVRSELADFKEETFLDPRHTVHHLYGTHDTALFLLRPDGHIAYRSLPPAQEPFLAYLHSIFPRVEI